jgi:hypothetical protein
VIGSAGPARIVLFGRRARREARPDSDYDLLVVLDQIPDRRAARLELRRSTGSAREPERKADYWLELALGDLIAGRELATNAAVPPRCAAFFAHQAAETAPRPASPTLAPYP